MKELQAERWGRGGKVRAPGGVRRRPAPIWMVGDKGTSRVRGPPGTERARIGGVGAIRREPADWPGGLGRGKSDTAGLGSIKNRGAGVTRDEGVGLEGGWN